MAKIKRYLRIYRLFLAQYLKILMQSKVNFFIGFSAFFLNQLSGIVFLYLLFRNIPTLSGWSIDALMFIYGFSQIPRGIDHIFTDYIWLLSGNVIVRGNFDKYLLRPLNPLFHLIAERFQPDGFGELAVGVGVCILYGAKLNLAFGFLDYVWMVVMIIGGTVIYTAIKLFFASLAFWMKRSQSLLFVVYQLSNFAKYPMSIYGKGLSALITVIIPFAFTAFIPAAYLLHRESWGYAVLGTTAAAVISFTIAYGVWLKGISKYESAGN